MGSQGYIRDEAGPICSSHSVLLSFLLSFHVHKAVNLLLLAAAAVVRMAHTNLLNSSVKCSASLVKLFAAILSSKANQTHDLGTRRSFDLLSKNLLKHCEDSEREYE
jgi:hypothetical protein